MSQSDQTDNLEQYRSNAGVESKTADISSEDHALKQAFGGSDEQKSFKFDAEIIAERISNWYDSDGATIREFLSNAETACIRRAKMELQKGDFSVPDEIIKIIEKANEKCDYEPLIEVTYNRKADDTRLIIEDNGCGITTEEYQVLRNIGYSATHSQGGVGDGFGMGIMSFAQLTGTHGMMKFSTRSFPSVDREETAYSVAMYVTNLEFLNGQPREYGTRFEFPGFAGDAKNVDILEKVKEFAQGMIVPVLYRDFDASGQETSRSDDYLATAIEDDYADDSMVISFENEFFKAVMSPDRKENGRGLTTYNISMPIRRNTDGFGSNKAFDAPWKWDFRGKREDGPIVRCPSDESLVGMIPKEDTKYDRLFEDLQEKCVPMSSVPDDAIVMPEPASSRDSFKSGHNDFWKFVSQKLNEEWASVARERFTDLNSWDDFLDMDRDEKHALFRAYSEFGPSYTDSEPDTIQETIEDNLGVTLDKDLGKRIHNSQSKVNVVRRGNNRAHTKGATTGKKIWQVIDEAPDGVYMGVSVSQKKADIAWGLGETHVVRVDDTSDYAELESSWDWDKLKELPSRNLEEKLPELDQDVIDQYDGVSASDSNNTQTTANTGGNGKDPETYRTKVRVGSNSRKYYTSHNVADLADALENDEEIKAGYYDGKYLIIFEDDVSARRVGNTPDRYDDVIATRVPEYVYDYLEGTKNVYLSRQDMLDDLAGVRVELCDDSVMDIRDLPETDALLSVGSKVEDRFEDRPEDLVEILGLDADDYDRFTFIDASDLDGSWDVSTDATVVRTYDSDSFEEFDDDYYTSMGFADIRFEDELGDMDKNSDEYEAMFGYRYGNPSEDTKETLIEIAKKAGLTQ